MLTWRWLRSGCTTCWWSTGACRSFCTALRPDSRSAVKRTTARGPGKWWSWRSLWEPWPPRWVRRTASSGYCGYRTATTAFPSGKHAHDARRGVGRRLCLCGGDGGDQIDGQTGVNANRTVPANYEKPGDRHARANTLLAVFNNNIINCTERIELIIELR